MQSVNPNLAKDIVCKNVLIYGHCKYEKKGCLFSHPHADEKPKREQKDKKRFNLNTPSFKPNLPVTALSSKFSTLSSGGKDSIAPEEKPKREERKRRDKKDDKTRKFDASKPSFTPSFEQFESFDALSQAHQNGPPSEPKQQNPYMPGAGAQSMLLPEYVYNQGTQAYPLPLHLYAPPPPPRLGAPKPHQTNATNLFIPNNLRELLTRRNEAMLQTLPLLNLPEYVHIYHSLVPLGSHTTHPGLNCPSAVYKATSTVDGKQYALTRFDLGPRINDITIEHAKKWMRVKCANIVALRDAFTTTAFSTALELALCVVHDYYPLSQTLADHLATLRKGDGVTAEFAWLVLAQIANAIIASRDNEVSAGGCLDTAEILVTSSGRVRLGSCGVRDIVEAPGQDTDKERLLRLFYEIGAEVQDPLFELNAHQFKSSLETSLESALEVSLRLGRTLDALQDQADYYEGQLGAEIENARLFRLMAKIEYVVAQDKDDTGTQIAHLFRDFVFCAQTEDGRPLVDLARVLVTLNKLDAGTSEKIMLVLRKEDTCIVMSYKEIKDALEQTFRAIYRV